MKTNEAVILCAGLGTRMRPITRGIPKCAIPFLGRPILHWTLSALEEAGIRRVFINLHHLPEAVMSCAETYNGKMEILFSLERDILGTAGFLRPLENRIAGDTFFVVNGDVIFSLPLEDLEDDLAQHPDALACLGLSAHTPPYTPVELDELGNITSFGSGDRLFLGIYAARKNLIAKLPPEDRSEFVGDLASPLLPSGRIRGCVLRERWLDIGTPEQFLSATLDALFPNHEWPSPPPGFTIEEHWKRPVLCHRSSWISQDAFFTGPAFVGPSCRVEHGTRLGHCAVIAGASLNEGDSLESAILSPLGRAQLTSGDDK